MSATMREIDIELLLQWAYRDELPKKHLSAAESVWSGIQEYGQRGGIDPGHGAAQRYAHFGLPDPDAIAIEKAVSQIPDIAVDWDASIEQLAGPLAGLVRVNTFTHGDVGNPNKRTVSGWTDRKSGKWQTAENKPRDFLMVSSVRPQALIIMHASKGTRPDVHDDIPRPKPTPATKGPHAMIVGICKGKDRYTIDSHCPLQWRPSPVSVVLARAEYVGWWEGLATLADRLNEEKLLTKFKALPPTAPLAPWLEPPEPARTIIHLPSGAPSRPLPLQPERGRMLAPYRSRKAGAGRSVLDQEASQ